MKNNTITVHLVESQMLFRMTSSSCITARTCHSHALTPLNPGGNALIKLVLIPKSETSPYTKLYYIILQFSLVNHTLFQLIIFVLAYLRCEVAVTMAMIRIRRRPITLQLQPGLQSELLLQTNPSTATLNKNSTVLNDT